jgi:hypothetical protein
MCLLHRAFGARRTRAPLLVALMEGLLLALISTIGANAFIPIVHERLKRITSDRACAGHGRGATRISDCLREKKSECDW